ncbi:2-succinyl-6-hydroxy-2,4-cyclohexadiene-1-carboxylate synthase [Paraliobacillus sediminis]|uniref:2-succinyl-6-hydroxy-2, 4-cyclohexadiene-1-carboxylate synthase n=1 Tax=Paraliobacillus sediminis TaxID=1885916 RepID=UPI000E3B9263|nr:2-succinyl-6-hydroxy-2,4-cyclohexadiene-1-carboxylate synthase [Paraliobacillus sediminis]
MYLTVNDRSYWIEENGDKTGIPILFLHGFTGSNKTWRETMASFSAYHCIALDLPGHGQTKSNDPVRMEDFCEDLALILNQLAIKQVHLVGYSMGGRAALSFTLIHSKMVASLTLESATPGLDSPNEQVARQTKDDSLAETIEKDGILAFVDQWESLPLFATQQTLSHAVKNEIRNERLAQSEKGLASSLRGMGTGKQPSWWDQLATITVPVLVIVGALDEKFVAIAKKMVQRSKTMGLHIVSNAGHAVHVEKKQKFDTIVKDFINDMEE